MDEQKIREFIGYLESEFIVEECEDLMMDGCLSCEAINVRYHLEKMLEAIGPSPVQKPNK